MTQALPSTTPPPAPPSPVSPHAATATAPTASAEALAARHSENTRGAHRDGAARTLRDRLSEREADVLRLMTAGLSNAEIADRLTVAPATVKTHVAAVLAKLGVRDRARAVIAAYEYGFVSPG